MNANDDAKATTVHTIRFMTALLPIERTIDRRTRRGPKHAVPAR
jgi:hypothetical protein